MTQTKRPNILFIMSDDHAAKSISAYGAGINHTPHLDRLAHEGMLFNHCYVTNSICTPSRAAILCGTHNHTNGVFTLDSKLDSNLPNVAKQLRAHGGYQTAMVGKWHLGEGAAHEPSGFDYWEVVPGQGLYHDPQFIGSDGIHTEKGYATDIITDKALNWLEARDQERPFFMMLHHKAPHRPWECDPKHRDLYKDDIRLPDTFTDDYKNRPKAAGVAKMKVAMDMTYQDLGLSQPEGGEEVGELVMPGYWERKIPFPDSDAGVAAMRPLIDRETGERFTFKTREALARFKYQRYMQRYLRTVQSIDDNVGRVLDYLDAQGLADNTMVLYTSDQGFFLGEHGWFDKRFIYEESFQMPLLIRAPGITAGSVCNDIVSNVDFATTWLDFAGLRIPSYMQGESFVRSLSGEEWQGSDAVAYHRYWMHADENHNAYAHYGIRDRRYKLIFWYNDGLGLPGTGPADAEKEWELFDCVADPLEIFNIWDEGEYADVRERMLRLLEAKMEDIGDVPAHPVGMLAEELRAMYPSGAGLSVKAGAFNM
ncbi:uncharacterized protein CcaverHIS019_0605140 [Cutaneotrichosporon cavernicola]|uniref:Sulfatase N-terminal domain-containing protein n=1 Tax=Cutaneotrichosporon cavernicola TaxID=279322 RepID=A0AA48L8W3_9TREE|nr:uncharacterized protein CcaverHIS019_0605140 [Cutaneotrichosporon cavernicola]BEI94055.1 hypothetical protein CcaverHIS019_0605140 [Cutaneotrichosporon cavernicola]